MCSYRTCTQHVRHVSPMLSAVLYILAAPSDPSTTKESPVLQILPSLGQTSLARNPRCESRLCVETWMLSE